VKRNKEAKKDKPRKKKHGGKNAPPQKRPIKGVNDANSQEPRGVPGMGTCHKEKNRSDDRWKDLKNALKR